ncbi:patatin-like phospholipase family protein [Demequina aestuarii]|uniref:patatin-like phospholipase family protein n=1 Tax=Demequina aestuarii TaxID=327095 RepID=UPI0007838C79|nr:patatin-like phospholipase family protein [Demequina aestuarii]
MVDEIDTANPQARRVLALDGGGIKGVFIAAFLAELERCSKSRVIDQFDLIAGTSTGGIVALGIGLGMSPAEILSIYERHGPTIFPRRGKLRQITRAKYDPAPLKSALEEVFGARKLGHSLTRMLIPSMSLNTGEVHI